MVNSFTIDFVKRPRVAHLSRSDDDATSCFRFPVDHHLRSESIPDFENQL